jgi:hypothetical protein
MIESTNELKDVISCELLPLTGEAALIKPLKSVEA